MAVATPRRRAKMAPAGARAWPKTGASGPATRGRCIGQDRTAQLMTELEDADSDVAGTWPDAFWSAAPDPAWTLEADGNGDSSRFSLSNGFLGVAADRTYIAGLFDAPPDNPAVPELV